MQSNHVHPLNKAHADLEGEVAAELSRRGFALPPELTYHAVLSAPFRQLLRAIRTPTSVYVRGRADRLAVHPGPPGCAFEWEVKTCWRYPDLACEALPFAVHMLLARIGIQCLYAFRNLSTGRDYGLWARPDPPAVRELRFPGRPDDRLINCLKTQFPGVPHLITRQTAGGSDDPFLVIDRAQAAKLPDWRTLLNKFPPSYTPSNGAMPC